MVFAREGYRLGSHLPKKFQLVEFKIAGISSSEIKRAIRDPFLSKE